jgi:hypothetical protein
MKHVGLPLLISAVYGITLIMADSMTSDSWSVGRGRPDTENDADYKRRRIDYKKF